MKYILSFLLCCSALAQQTVNNFAVKTNLTVSGAQAAAKVNTAADLIALTPVQDGMMVQTLGRNTAGDGGGATFRFVAGSTTSTNLGTVFGVSGGRFVWIGNSDMNVKMFGAIPNDSIIDSDSIANAISVGVANESAIYAPPGRYLVDKQLVLSNGEFYGSRTEQSRVGTGVNTVLVATNWNLTTYPSIVKVTPAGPGAGAPYVHGIEVIGSRTNTVQSKVPITSVIDRFTVEISNTFTPSFQSGSRTNIFPFFGWMFVFSPGGNYMGSAVVTGTTNTGTSWRLSTQYGYDWFATPAGTGGLLTTNCYLAFSGLSTTSSGAQLADPTKTGMAGIEITGGIGARVSDCATFNTWTGVNFGVTPSTSFPFLENITTVRTSFAGYSVGLRGVFEGGSDVIHNGYLFGNGYGAADIEIPTDSKELGNGTFGFYNVPTTSLYDKFLMDGFVIGGFINVNGGIGISEVFLDNCMYGGLMVVDGQYTVGPALLTSFGYLHIRGSLTPTYPISRPDSFAIRVVGTTLPANIHAAALDISTSFQNNFANAFDITNAVSHNVSVGRMPLCYGFTNWITASSLLPIIENSQMTVQTNRFLGVAYSQSTNYLNGTTWAIRSSGTNRLEVGSTGVFGYAGNTPSQTFAATTGSFTAIGNGTIYNKTDQYGVYIGNRSAGSPTDATANVLLEAGSGNAVFTQQAYNGSAAFAGRVSGGTQASPTAATGNQNVVSITGQAYDGSAYNPIARVNIVSAQLQSAINRASRIEIDVTPDGSTTRATAVRVGGGTTRNVRIEPDGVSANADASAALDVTSTNQGILFPRMTTVQRDAIVSASNGLVIYNTSTSKLQVRAGGVWVDLH
jgi:hypothetical protein